MPSPTGPPTFAAVYVAAHRLPRPGVEEPAGPEHDLGRIPLAVRRMATLEGATWLVTAPLDLIAGDRAVEVLGVWSADTGGHLLHVIDLPQPLAPFGRLQVAELRLPPPPGLDFGHPGAAAREAAEADRLRALAARRRLN